MSSWIDQTKIFSEFLKLNWQTLKVYFWFKFVKGNLFGVFPVVTDCPIAFWEIKKNVLMILMIKKCSQLFIRKMSPPLLCSSVAMPSVQEYDEGSLLQRSLQHLVKPKYVSKFHKIRGSFWKKSEYGIDLQDFWSFLFTFVTLPCSPVQGCTYH